MKAVRVGCSGWNYPHWRRVLYPPGLPPRRWLAHYATLFDTVEVNATFYRLPTRAAVRSWVDGTPPGFVFAVKASRYLTHVKRLTDTGEGVKRFCERLEPLLRSPKLGPILWQLPENFLADHGVALVIGDHPERPFQTHDLATDWTFIRFHYGRRGRKGNYSDGELETWAGRIREWRKRIEVFAYFNNDWGGFAVKNGLALKQRLGG
ncbi:MAG: DUF72 domain-containing protein [Deltaproteobacteria bacterium]|nr:MAG: DUF72 domain-containing protein [Deltaproteobacteria bacterium]